MHPVERGRQSEPLEEEKRKDQRHVEAGCRAFTLTALMTIPISICSVASAGVHNRSNAQHLVVSLYVQPISPAAWCRECMRSLWGNGEIAHGVMHLCGEMIDKEHQGSVRRE
eukprot:751101-Hanusia_phi.AAC.2